MGADVDVTPQYDGIDGDYSIYWFCGGPDPSLGFDAKDVLGGAGLTGNGGSGGDGGAGVSGGFGG